MFRFRQARRCERTTLGTASVRSVRPSLFVRLPSSLCFASLASFVFRASSCLIAVAEGKENPSHELRNFPTRSLARHVYVFVFCFLARFRYHDASVARKEEYSGLDEEEEEEKEGTSFAGRHGNRAFRRNRLWSGTGNDSASAAEKSRSPASVCRPFTR